MNLKNVSVTSSPSSSSVVVIAVLTTSLVVIFSSWSAGVHCQELVHGKVKPVPENPKSADRSATSESSATFPSSLKVDVTLGRRPVHLSLTKDSGFEPRLPVYVLSADAQGSLQSYRARLNDTEFAVYQDVRNEGAFGVFRENDANGTSRYKLQGIVHADGKIYSLLSVKKHAESKTRLRRHATSADNTSNDVNGVDDDTARKAKEKEEEQQEEADEEMFEADEMFEVTELPEKIASDGTGGIPAPPIPGQGRRKVMMRKGPQVVPSVSPAPSSPSATSQQRLPPPPDPPKRRRKRQGTQQVYVDVVAFVDYGVYKAWYDRTPGTTTTEKEQNTLQDIRRYYAIVMNGVDLLYKAITSVSYTINVRLVGIVISTTARDAPWTENLRRSTSGRWDRVDADGALKALRTWVANTDVTLPAYDHLMLFTGYDLTVVTDAGVLYYGVTGLAYTSTLCLTEGQAVSIVEDLGGFQCIATAAHELGHGLSAEHDGKGNSCQSSDRYIMADTTYPATNFNKLNPWRFSSCSVNYFTTFIRDTVLTARGQQCLYNSLPINAAIPNVTSILPGQLYSPDEQCRQIYGPGSRYCRGEEFGQPSDICTDMYCYDPSSDNSCFRQVAARGSTCGRQKWCQRGQCVEDAAAPIVDDTCIFGDQPGIAFQGADCATFVDAFPGYCYQSVVRSRCCASCAKHLRLLTDCDYGDKVRGCSSSACRLYDRDSQKNCCGTCNYGTPFTTTPTPTLFPLSTTAVTCVDDPAYSSTCFTLIAGQSNLCYDTRARAQCCKTCRDLFSGVKDCEYGDRDPSQCLEAQTNIDVCSSLQSVCCKTCAGYSSSSSPVVVIANSPFSLLVTGFGIVLFLSEMRL